MRHRRTTRIRRGLAPLEFVLAAPLILFVTALSVIFGIVACWKVRAEGVARDAIFAARFPRRGRADPQSVEWRTARANRSVHGAADVDQLNHSVFQNSLIRGPLPGGISVNREMLDPTNHARVGRATLEAHDARVLGSLGRFSLSAREELLDNKWQYAELGFGSNTSRRLRRLWDLLNVPAAMDEQSRYVKAYQTTSEIYARPELFVLDRDDELATTRWVQPPGGEPPESPFDLEPDEPAPFQRTSSPNFHPRPPRFCSTEAEDAERSVMVLLQRIDRVPLTMTNAFLNYYRRKLAELQGVEPPDAAAIAALEQKIKVLEKFKDSLN